MSEADALGKALESEEFRALVLEVQEAAELTMAASDAVTEFVAPFILPGGEQDAAARIVAAYERLTQDG